MYHELDLTQSAIARQLDVSQATVSRLLKRAQELDIVRITVNIPSGIFTGLENKLCERYQLKVAIVVDCDDDSEEVIQHHIGSAAAYYIENTLQKNEVVGLSSWSSTLLSMVNAMHPLTKATDATVVQILGGMGNPSAEIYAARLTERFAGIVGGEPVYLPVPGVAKSTRVRQTLLDDTYVQDAIKLFDQVTLALVGIGSVEPSKLLASSGNVFSGDELDMLREAGAAGDICLHFFDASGKPVESSLTDRVIGIGFDQLKKVKRTVALAGGKRKTDAILGALRGGWLDVLITDRLTAERILDQN